MVVEPTSRAAQTSGFALGLLFVTAVIELAVIAFASAGFDEVADASPFGRPGTAIAAAVIAVVALAGTAETGNGYVIKAAGRYRLDPTIVDVDLWTLRDLLPQRGHRGKNHDAANC